MKSLLQNINILLSVMKPFQKCGLVYFHLVVRQNRTVEKEKALKYERPEVDDLS